MLRTGIVVVALLLGSAAQAETWFGTVKVTAGCSGQRAGKDRVNVTITMERGTFGDASIVLAGVSSDAFSDRIPGKRGEAFIVSAVDGDAAGGAITTISGTIKGNKLKGVATVHVWDTQTACMIFGKVKAKR